MGQMTIEVVRAACMAKPGATEDEPWPNDTVWKVGGKMFCIWSGHDCGISVKSTLDKQAALVQHPDIKIASYVGRYGWVTVTPQDQDTMELALELIDESYGLVSAKLPRAKKQS